MVEPRDPAGRSLVEGRARVIALEEGQVLLEPIVSSGCKGCVSAGLCGAMAGSNSLAARRFRIPDGDGLKVGDRVVVGLGQTALLKASWLAYAIPLLLMLTASMAADRLWGRDGVTALCAVGGLGAGMVWSRWRAAAMSRRGELTPRYLGPAPDDDVCNDHGNGC